MDRKFSKQMILNLLEYFSERIKEEDLDFNTVENLDYYWWSADDEKLYDPSKNPKYDWLWQITDDWGMLMDLLEGKRIFSWYEFRTFSNIIRLLALVSRNTVRWEEVLFDGEKIVFIKKGDNK